MALTLTNSTCWILSRVVSNFTVTVTLIEFVFRLRNRVSTLVHQLALLRHPNPKKFLVRIGCLSFAFVTLKKKTRWKLGRLNFHEDFWDCYQGQGKKLPTADWRVPSSDPRNNCGKHCGSSFFVLFCFFFVVSKVANGKTGRFTNWVLNGTKNSGLVNFIPESCLLLYKSVPFTCNWYQR